MSAQTQEQTLFERLGGRVAVEAAVVKFYEKVLADPMLNPFFQNTNMEKQQESQTKFMIAAFGGPNEYTGADMRTAHKQVVAEGANDEHFDKVATHLKTTLEELGIDAGLISEVLDIVGSTRNDVLNK